MIASDADAVRPRGCLARLAHRVALVVGAVAVYAFAWLYRFNDPGGSFAGLTDDHFFYLVRGWQILFGELPVRDFVDHGAPLYYYVGAAVQQLFGRGTLSELAFSVTVLAACAAGVFLLASRAAGSALLGLGGAALHVLLDPRFYNYPKILAYVAAIPVLWLYADRPRPKVVAALAFVTAAALLFRHDHGVFIGLAFAVLLVLLTSVRWADRLRHAALYVALVAVLLAPYFLFVQMNGGVLSYFRTAAAWAERDRDRAEVVWPGLFENPDGVSDAAQQGGPVGRAVATIRDNWIAWGFYAELALPFVALLLLALSRNAFRLSWPNAGAKLGMVAILAIVLNAGFLRHPLEARLADPSVAHAILFAWLLVAGVRVLRRRDLLRAPLQRAFVAIPAGIIAATAAAGVVAVLAIASTRDLHERLDKASLVDGPGRALRRVDVIWEQYDEIWPLSSWVQPEQNVIGLALYLEACTRPTDRVFMQHYLPQVLALSRRGFAGGHADLRPGFFTSDEMQALTIERLRRQSVPVAVLATDPDLASFRQSFPAVTAYLDEHYVAAGDRLLDDRFGIHLLVSRRATPTGRYAPLDWPCFT